jgi:hypothetical protein
MCNIPEIPLLHARALDEFIYAFQRLRGYCI